MVNQLNPQITSVEPKINLLPIVVTALICATLFSFGGYYLGKQSQNSQQYFPTSSPTSIVSDKATNWKLYSNTKYGYLIKYPEPDPELQKFDKYTDELVEINGGDNLIIRIEPVVTSETNSANWWKTQKTEAYSHKSVECFTQKTVSEIKSLYDPNQIVIKFNKSVFVVDNLISEQGMTESCYEPPQVRVVLVTTNKGLLKITYTWAIQAEQILSTFTLL